MSNIYMSNKLENKIGNVELIKWKNIMFSRLVLGFIVKLRFPGVKLFPKNSFDWDALEYIALWEFCKNNL